MGVELDEPRGKHDGMVKGIRFFQCAPNRGVMTRVNSVNLVPPKQPAGQPPQQQPAPARQRSRSVHRSEPAQQPQQPQQQPASHQQQTHREGLAAFRAALDATAHKSDSTASPAAAAATAASGAAQSASLRLESRVVVWHDTDDPAVGTVKYIGPFGSSQDVWVGIELDEQRGRHDGTIDGQRLFVCRPGHGILTRRRLVRLLKKQ